MQRNNKFFFKGLGTFAYTRDKLNFYLLKLVMIIEERIPF